MATRYEIQANIQGFLDAAGLGSPGVNLLTAKSTTVAITGLPGMYAALTAVTGTASTDLFTKTAHGLANGDVVGLSAMSGGVGLLTEDTRFYYVITSTANTFQLANSPGGTAVDFTSDISSVTVTKRPLLVLYSAESGSTTTANPTTSDATTGRVNAWIQAPDYDLTVSGTNIQTTTARIRQSPSGVYNVLSYGAIGDNSTDDTAACQAAITAAGGAGRGEVHFPTNLGYVFASAPTIPDKVTLSGEGYGSMIRYTGTGTFLSYASVVPLTLLQELRIHLTNDNSVAILLSNSFLASCVNCYITGEWLNSTDASYRGQTGVQLRSNAGDNHFINCKFLNLGSCVRTDSIMNFFSSCHFGTYQRGIYVDQTAFGGGFTVSDTTFVGDSSNPSKTLQHIYVSLDSNACHINNCWFEGADVGWELGHVTNGWANQFKATNCTIAARTTCIKVVGAGRPFFAGITFSADPGATPTMIAFTTGPEGVMIMPWSSMGAYDDPALSTFPSDWTVIGRREVKLGANLTTHGGLGFFGTATGTGKPATYTLNSGATSRNLPSGATAAQVEQVVRQILKDLGDTAGMGLLDDTT